MSARLASILALITRLPSSEQDAVAEVLTRLVISPPRPSLTSDQIAELNRRYGDGNRAYVPIEEQ